MANELIIVDQGEEQWLDLIVDEELFVILLAGTDQMDGKTITEVDALLDTDIDEPTFTGYAAKALDPSAWTVTPGNPATATTAQQTFTVTSTGSGDAVYGWGLMLGSNFDMVQITGFGTWSSDAVPVFTSSPIHMGLTGDEIRITPAINLRDNTDG